MSKYRLAIYTDPKAKIIYEHEFEEIEQGLILARDWGHKQWVASQDLENIQWHIKPTEGNTNEDGIKLIIGNFTCIGYLIISGILKK